MMRLKYSSFSKRFFRGSLVFVLILFLLLLLSNNSDASQITYNRGFIDLQNQTSVITKAYVAYVRGTIDQGVKNYLRIALDKAESEGAALIMDTNSPGGFLGDTMDITDMIMNSKVPVIGFASGDSYSGATLILIPTHILAVNPYANIGDAQPVTIGPTGEITPITEPKIINPLIKKYTDIAEIRGRNATLVREFILNATVVNGVEAVRYKVADLNAVSLEDLVNKIRGREVKIGDVTYVLNIERLENAPECITCSVLSLFSDPTISGIMITIAVFSIIFSIASGHLIGIPIALIFLFLGLLGSGFNISLISVIMIVLGIAFLGGGIILGGSDGGILIVSGLILLGLGGMFLPVVGREILVSGTEGVLTSLYYASLGIGVGAGSIGAFIALQLVRSMRIRHRIFEITGKEGVARDEITPEKEGFVLVEGELWRAISEKDYIKPGDRIVVVAKKDFLLIVRRA
ncbi:MAG: NfeD family protein [Sulfolobales archaeon]